MACPAEAVTELHIIYSNGDVIDDVIDDVTTFLFSTSGHGVSYTVYYSP